MRTKEEWDKDIKNITNLIYRRYPELSKFICEIPFKDSEEAISLESLKDYYHSLEELVFEYAKTHGEKVPRKNIEKSTFPGYPHYPPSEDIYSQAKKEMNLNPEDLSKNKTPNENRRPLNVKDFEEDMSGEDLDIPGSELDDQQESIGSEDEENNYYSLGGDRQEGQGENKG